MFARNIIKSFYVKHRRQILLSAALIFVIWGCGSSTDELTKTPTPQGSAEQLFAEGKADYAKQDYEEAIRVFDQVRIQAPASPMAAEATYLEGMSRFNQEMYAGSAQDFRAVRRSYPSSPYAARAQYMVGESYFQISPQPLLDQSYSILALTEFENFLHDYPNASVTLADSAQKRIVDIRDKLAEKYFLAAKLYEKLDAPKSAIIYYQRVLDNFYDTPPATESQLRIAEIDLDLKKYDDARKALANFDTKYLQLASPSERKRALELHSKLSVPQ